MKMSQQKQGLKFLFWIYSVVTILIFIAFVCSCNQVSPKSATTQESNVEQGNVMELPGPKHDSTVSLEQTLLQRRSVRSYTEQLLTLEDVSQLLWAAQGITEPGGFRTAPSAGALYPLEVYVVAGDVQGLYPGVYHYIPDGHQVIKILDGDKRIDLADAALGQESVRNGAVVFVFTGIYERTTTKYGERGVMYVHIELGHAAQNLCLQATAMGLGAVTIGAFYDEQVADLLALTEEEQPLYIIPVGRK
jgi:SagB-type dehydrogenase family enzyme